MYIRTFFTRRIFTRTFFEKVFASGTALAVLFSLLAPFASIPYAEAAITTNTATNVLPFGLSTVKASSSAQALIGLNMVQSASETFDAFNVALSGSAGFVTGDLAAMATGATSGIALYQDDAVTGTNGSFDATDDVVTLASAPTLTQVTQFSKIAPTATALVTDSSMTITAGDIAFSYHTANPAEGTYSWHLVTTGGTGVNAAGLRLDVAGAAPTFGSGSRFSKLTPAATALGNGAGGGGTVTVAAGDLVFARRATEGTYTWHIATGGGTTLSDDGTENTGALDDAADDPAVFATTQFSKIVPSGSATDNGATGGGLLTVALGDLVFIKIGSTYGWHIVTTAGDLSSNATENTAFIDGGAADPAIVASSQMSKISTASGTFQITTATTSDSSLVITAGDLGFAGFTNNPFRTSTNWGMVTTGATGVSGAALRVNANESGSPAAPSFGWTTRLTAAAGQAVPANDTGANLGSDYFVVVKTASGATNAHAFTLALGAGDVLYSANTPLSSPSPAAIVSLTVDTTAPTVSAAYPANTTANVPVSSSMFADLSEDLDPSTLTPANITFQITGGASVPFSLRTFPDGFDLVPSVAPTYTASSRWSKPVSTTAGFYFIPNSGAINPNSPPGGYTAPTAGDIILFQHESFPMEIGVVTNATLTAGTFAVNGFNLYGDQNLVKFGTVATTGLEGTATSLTVGDLVVANTTANPTSTRYDWHLVTAGTAVNDAALRFDSSGSAPTFVTGSRVSSITTNDTSAVNGSSQVVGSAGGGIDLGVGDLIFAKVTANADNLNAYAWHIVTAAENITTDAAPGALRLDGKSSAPTFAASTRISLIDSSTQGAVSDASPTFNQNDIVFASVTGGGFNANSYNFHLVTGGGAPNAAALRFDNFSTPLNISTSYTLTIGTGVTDRAGNAIASSYSTQFTTGSTGTTNNTPPFVISSIPFPGMQTFPIVGNMQLTFSEDMSVVGGTSGANSVTNAANVGFSLDNFGVPGASVAATRTYDSATKTLTINPDATLTASTGYIVRVFNTAQSTTGAGAGDFFVGFKTASAADTTRPKVLGVYPAPAASSVALPVSDIAIGFGEDMDPSTVNATNITISPAVAGTVSYDAMSRSAHFTPTAGLATSTTYTVTVGTAVADLSANGLEGNGGVANAANTTNGTSSTYVFNFGTSATADTGQPTVSFSNADNYHVAITYSEAMKTGGGPSAVDNIANYALESPVGTSIGLAGKTLRWESSWQTAIIDGLSLQNGVTYKVTVSNLAQDLAGNFINTGGSPAGNIAQGTVQSSQTTSGQLGPGSGPDQSAGSYGITPIMIMPMNRMAGATSNYHVEFPSTQSIEVDGTITLTFPTGFDVTNADKETTANSPSNSDLNGPATGTVTMGTVTKNATARTVTIPIAGAATGANSFLVFDLKSIVNSTVPSSTGYQVDIKTKNSSGVILESLTTGPFFLGQSGTRTLTVNVFNDNGAGGGTAGNNVKDGSEAGFESAKVFIFNPMVGGQTALTNASGVATFSSLPDSTDYMLGVDVSNVATALFNVFPQPLSISTNTTKNFGMQAPPRTISGTIAGGVGLASTALDVGAMSQSGNFVLKTVTLDGSGNASYTLPANNNTSYTVAVMPAMPKGYMDPGAPPPPVPSFNFMPPAPANVAVALANVTQNFTITATNKTIAGSVKDSGGNGIADVMVFARPAAADTVTGGEFFGTGAQTKADGTFILNVTPGVYIVDAFKPGMPMVSDKQITVPDSGDNVPTSLAFVFDAGTSLTISGRVYDQNGNAVPYAGVGAFRVTDSSSTTAIGGGSENFIGGPTDANGNYTLYVGAGTWVVEAFAPGFGRLGQKTVTVSTASVSGQDFSAATLNLGTITGQATQNSVPVQGVGVRVEATSGTNMGSTDGSGNYSVKVPAGTYTVTCFFPGIGEATPLTGVVVTANTTTASQNCSIGSPITVTINLTDGTAGITGAFVDARDSNGRGYGTSASTTSGANAVYTLTLAPGTYTVRAMHPAYGELGSTTGVSTTQAITYTASLGVRYAVSGTIQVSAAALSGAWVSLTGTPTGSTRIVSMGDQTSSTGTFSISVPNGSYRIRADKPGYISPSETTITVNGANVANGITSVTAAAQTIGGTVSLSGTGVSNAFVDADNGAGGYAVAQTNASGVYSLSVSNGTWTVRAHSQGYSGGPLSVTVSSNNPTGQDIALSAISGYTFVSDTETITPSSGGTVTNSDIGSAFKLTIPPAALGSSSNSATITTQTNSAVADPPTADVIEQEAITISAVDSSGQSISTLTDSVTLVIPYSESNLPAGTTEANLVVGVWNEATQSYDMLATVVNTTANTLTVTVDHFSDFAPLVQTDPTAPSTPASFTVNNSGDGSHASASWTAVSGASSYSLYRSTDGGSTFPLFVSGLTGTSYTISGLANNTTYQFKLTAVNSGGGESAATSAVTVGITVVPSGGGGTPTPTPIPTPTPTPVTSTTTGTIDVVAATGGTTSVTTSESTTATVNVPANAVSATTTFTVTPVAKTASSVAAAATAVPSGKQIVGTNMFNHTAAVAGGVVVTNFNAAVTLSFTYTDAQVAGLSLSSLTIYFWNGSVWSALPTSVNTATRTVTAPTTHFSTFALMGEPEPTLQIVDTQGTALVDGDLIKTADSFDIYIAKMVGAKKFRRLILNPDIFNSYGHLSWSAVKTVSQEVMAAFTISETVMEVYADGTPVSGKVYRLTSELNSDVGVKRWLNVSASQFEGAGYDWDAIYKINHIEAGDSFYPEGTAITQ